MRKTFKGFVAWQYGSICGFTFRPQANQVWSYLMKELYPEPHTKEQLIARGWSVETGWIVSDFREKKKR